jgi:mannose-6-phosphate isomerase-like protein (cupin superfamily)
LKDDDVVIIPAGKEHYVKNTGDKDLKLYTIYSPPEHPPETVHKTKEEADAAEH